MSAILKFDLQNENNYIFSRKLSKLHEKDIIFYVTIIFFLKQGQTRANNGPLTLSLTWTSARADAVGRKAFVYEAALSFQKHIHSVIIGINY